MGVYLPCNKSTINSLGNSESFLSFDVGSQRLLCQQDVYYILYGRKQRMFIILTIHINE